MALKKRRGPWIDGIRILGPADPFPDPRRAPSHGLVAFFGSLEPERLLEAYRLGIFPWYSEGEPLMWHSPDPRCVLFPGEFHVSRSLAKLLRRDPFRYTMDEAFDRVIDSCAVVHDAVHGGTWITPDMLRSYKELHRMGWAHSLECWRDGDLVGGIYGLSIGRAFFGESMFSLVPNASKAAMWRLVRCIEALDFAFLDCQAANEHTLSLGAREVPRSEFLDLLAAALRAPDRCGRWRLGGTPSPQEGPET